MIQRGVYVRTANWPPANENTFQALRQVFAGVPIDLIEVKPLIKRRPVVVANNMIQVVRDYGSDIVQRRRSLKDCFFRTPYIFHAIGRMVREQMAGKQYDFSFQIQSLFDASQPGVPHFVYTDHTHLANLWYEQFKQCRLYTQAWIDCERSVYHNAAMVFTRSSNISQSLIEQYDCDPADVTCVYAGVNVQADQTRFNADKYASKNILFVGMDWERKGGPELVAAFKQVLAVHPDAHLTIVGATPDVDVPNCTVVGRVSIEAVAAYYEQAAVFCMPSKLEPFGVVFTEAMSYKLPVVAAHVGAVPDLITDGENGYIVEPGAVDPLAERLITLIGDPAQCRAFGEAGDALVKQRYSWKQAAQAMKTQIERRAEAQAVVADRPVLA